MAVHPQTYGLDVGSKVVSIPRWLEVKDLRNNAEVAEPSRTMHYVVSPFCSGDNAEILAAKTAQRERLARAHSALEQAQVPLVLVGFGLFIVVLVGDLNPLWYAAILGVYLVTQYMRMDADAELSTPLDIAAMEQGSATKMFHRVSAADFNLADSFALKYPERAHEAHAILWRMYDLAALHASARQELMVMRATDDLDPEDDQLASRKLVALEALVKDSQQAFRELVSPRYPVLPLGRDRLLELFHRVDAALHDGKEILAPRIAAEQERVRQYQQSLDGLAATTASSFADLDALSAGPDTPDLGTKSAPPVVLPPSPSLEFPEAQAGEGHSYES